MGKVVELDEAGQMRLGNSVRVVRARQVIDFAQDDADGVALDAAATPQGVSERAVIKLGDFILGQDTAKTGVKNFGLLDANGNLLASFNQGVAAAGMDIVIARSAVQVATPADTSEDILATITTPAGALGPNGYIVVEGMAAFNNNANAKAIRVRFGGIGGTAYLAATGFTTQLGIQWRTIIQNRNAANSQVGGSPYIVADSGTLFTTAKQTGAVDTTAATTLVITGQKAVAGDTLTLERYQVELVYGA